MKEEKDIKQQVLDAMDDSVEDMLQHSDAQLESEVGMETYRIEVGHMHGVKPANIVGAIANEAGIESRFIGRIGLYEESSTVELPAGMPAEAANALKRTRIRGVPINLRQDEGRPSGSFGGERKFDGERKFKKKTFDR